MISQIINLLSLLGLNTFFFFLKLVRVIKQLKVCVCLWVRLPCRHSVALNHPKVYKKMWVSWETWILPWLSVSPFFLPISVFFVSRLFVPLPILSLPCLLLLTSFPSPRFPLSLTFFPPLSVPCPLLSSHPSGDDEGSQYQGKSLQGVCILLSFIFLSQASGFCGAQHSS